MKKLSALALAPVVALALAAPASADHAWGSYHWARTASPFTLELGSNLTGSWTASPSGPGYLALVSADWSQSSVLDTVVVAGAGRKRCRAVSGRLEVCNDAYGRNGWLGAATIWLSGSHITQATVKLNDTYFNTATYGTPEWRQSVMCQEVGHTFGLDHQSEDPEVDEQSCMDYYKVPNLHPDAHDFEQLESIYAHLDSAPTGGGKGRGKGGGKGRGLRKVSDSLYVEDLGHGHRRFVWVTWKDQGVPHGPPAGVE